MLFKKDLPSFITKQVMKMLSDQEVVWLMEYIALDLAGSETLSTAKKGKTDFISVGQKAIKHLSPKERVEFIKELATQLHQRMP